MTTTTTTTTTLAPDLDTRARRSRGAWLDGVDLADPALAATLELLYLRPLLAALPADRRTAVDVGAHRGHVAGELLQLGFKVLAVEPQDFLADHLTARFAAEAAAGRFHLRRCAASDRTGTSRLFVGSASTVCSLEADWTTVAFPEQFRAPRHVDVPLRPAGELVAKLGWGASLGFAKVDVEGHEEPALRGLLDGGASTRPSAVMFEANHCFPDRATACVELLWSRGYRTFDLFVRWGVDPIGGARFREPVLPAAWHEGRAGFYANLIAYHDGSPAAPDAVGPDDFVREYARRKRGGDA